MTIQAAGTVHAVSNGKRLQYPAVREMLNCLTLKMKVLAPP